MTCRAVRLKTHAKAVCYPTINNQLISLLQRVTYFRFKAPHRSLGRVSKIKSVYIVESFTVQVSLVTMKGLKLAALHITHQNLASYMVRYMQDQMQCHYKSAKRHADKVSIDKSASHNRKTRCLRQLQEKQSQMRASVELFFFN
jgi:hypothetical protein